MSLLIQDKPQLNLLAIIEWLLMMLQPYIQRPETTISHTRNDIKLSNTHNITLESQTLTYNTLIANISQVALHTMLEAASERTYAELAKEVLNATMLSWKDDNINFYVSFLESILEQDNPTLSDKIYSFIQQLDKTTFQSSDKLSTAVIDTNLTNWEAAPWTEEEIAQMLIFEPKSGAELMAEGLTGLWADRDIPDSVEWVKTLRAKE